MLSIIHATAIRSELHVASGVRISFTGMRDAQKPPSFSPRFHPDSMLISRVSVVRGCFFDPLIHHGLDKDLAIRQVRRRWDRTQRINFKAFWGASVATIVGW